MTMHYICYIPGNQIGPVRNQNNSVGPKIRTQVRILNQISSTSIRPTLCNRVVIFLPLRAIFGVGVRFKNFFLTILYRQSTLVLKVQPYLLFTIRPYLGLLLDFFGPFGAFFGIFWGYFWGRGQVQKHFWNLLM